MLFRIIERNVYLMQNLVYYLSLQLVRTHPLVTSTHVIFVIDTIFDEDPSPNVVFLILSANFLIAHMDH